MGAVNEAVTAVALPRAMPGVRPRLQRTQAAAVLGFLLANGVAIVWLWAHGGNLEVEKTADTAHEPRAADGSCLPPISP